MRDAMGDFGSPLRNSLWNLLYRVVSGNDHSGTAWGAILRGVCLAFLKKAIDDLPASDNEASRRVLKEAFFGLPEHRVYDLFEFLLADDRAGMKEVDRKLIRRSMNPVLEEEAAPVRLLRDRFVPIADELGLDSLEAARETLSLFDRHAAARHLQAAVAFLSRRPEPAAKEAVREAVIAVAAVVRTVAGGSGEIAMGTVAPVAGRLGLSPGLEAGIESMLSRCHAVSGLPGGGNAGSPVGFDEAVCLVVFCSSIINLVLSRGEGKPGE